MLILKRTTKKNEKMKNYPVCNELKKVSVFKEYNRKFDNGMPLINKRYVPEIRKKYCNFTSSYRINSFVIHPNYVVTIGYRQE